MLKNEAERVYAMEDKDARYWLMAPTGWEEVSMQEFVHAERRAGFHNTLGRPERPATGGFSSGRMRGAVTYSGEPPRPLES